MQDDITSLEFLSSEDHLIKNIRKWEFEVVSKWEVNIKLYVKQANLWEGARSYVWKFQYSLGAIFSFKSKNAPDKISASELNRNR